MNILQFGCGRWGRLVLRDLLALGCAVDVVDPDADARAAATASGASSVRATAARGSRPDGVVLATPASMHLDGVHDAARFGVPVFVEKPMVVDRDSAAVIRGLRGPPVFVMHTWRYHPGIGRLAEIAATGELGAPESLRSTRSNWTSPRTDVDPIWTLLPHDLSIALEVLGAIPKPVSAQTEFHAGRPVGMMAMLALGTIRVFCEVSTRDPGRRREVFLRCAGGVAVLRSDRDGWIEIRRDDRDETERRRWPREPRALQRELAVFVDYLRGGPPPKCDAAVGEAIVDAVVSLRELAGIA